MENSNNYRRIPDEIKRQIIIDALNTDMTQKAIAKKYGVGKSSVSAILSRTKLDLSKIKSHTEKEPAPVAAETSSTKENISQPHNTTDERKCQETIKKVLESMLHTYESMTEAEQRAFDMGERYGLLETVAEGGGDNGC